jgi:hypothetical protein
MSFLSVFGGQWGDDIAGHIGVQLGTPWLGRVFSAIGTFAGLPTDTGYRPLSWGFRTSAEQLVYMQTNVDGLFFDDILSTNTQESITITSHPVQSGANISDHAFRNPTKISMEIMMSDVMASRVPGQFASGGNSVTRLLGMAGVPGSILGMFGGGADATKSISAYQRLVELQRMRLPFSVKTRLGYYNNMLIESIDTPDDVNTLSGLKCTINMREILVAQVATEKVSARPWTTSKGTNNGSVEPGGVPESILSKVPGAGGGTGGSQGVQW